MKHDSNTLKPNSEMEVLGCGNLEMDVRKFLFNFCVVITPEMKELKLTRLRVFSNDTVSKSQNDATRLQVCTTIY